jgi:O-antigen/teichoic acid export membrane protein
MDQVLSVGGSFLVNVALARTRTKEEYGMFALSYSVFIFLLGVHNAAILEPFTVYGSGRYRERFSAYLRLIARSNVLFGALLSALILLVCLVFWYLTGHLLSRALVGLGLTVGFLLLGVFLRRAFYVQREPALAAKSSFAFFITVILGLWFTLKLDSLDSLSVFLILAVGWIVAIGIYGRKLALGRTQSKFLGSEPKYWRIHWNYARWVLVTAFVFQLMTQGYYWLVAGFLSVREVGELRAINNLIAPVDQIFIALSYLLVPAMASHYAANHTNNLLSLWKRYTVAILGVTALFALGVRILGQQLLQLLYAGRFDGLAPLLFWLALLPMVTAVGNTMAQALKAAEKPRLVFYAFVSSGAATFGLGLPLVARLGLRGAVYGMLLSGAIFTAAMAVSFLRSFNIRVQQGKEQIRLPHAAAQERS